MSFGDLVIQQRVAGGGVGNGEGSTGQGTGLSGGGGTFGHTSLNTQGLVAGLLGL